MSWIITHTITAPFQDSTLLNTGLIVTHQINPVLDASSAQIQSDWNQTNNTLADFIKNKPSITSQINADWNAVTGVAEILNKPTIPAAQMQTDWNAIAGMAVLLNKPTITGSNTGDETQSSIQTKLSTLLPANFEVFSFAISDETSNLSAGTSKITIHWPFNFTLSSVFIGASTAPTGTNLIVDANDHNGTSIFSTRPTILVNEFTSLTNGTQPVLVTTMFTKGQKLTVDLDVVGSTVTGKALKIYFIGIKS
jgi:hypothetical protein